MCGLVIGDLRGLVFGDLMQEELADAKEVKAAAEAMGFS